MRIFTLLLCVLAGPWGLMAQEINLLLDIAPGTTNSAPNNMFLYQGEVYFGADRDAEGRELWKSDGTATGTVLVKDLRPGPDNSTPSFFFTLKDTLYFSANTGFGNVLFKSDGTSAGTGQISTDFVFRPINVGDSVVYFIYTSQGNALYTFDGTTIAPAPNTGQGTASVLGANFAYFQDRLFLYMDYSTDFATVGRELYQYDFFTDSFTLVKDIVPGGGNSSISEFAALGDFLYFEANNELWQTDGSGGGTVPVATVTNAGIVDVQSLYVWKDMLFFEADSGSGDQLFVYKPGQDVVLNLSQISGANTDHDPADFTPFNGYLYYRGEDGNDGNAHLFRTAGDNIEQMDSLIVDVDDIVRLGDRLFFEAEDPGVTGNEPFTFTAPLLVPAVSGQTVVCPGERTTLTASGAPSGNWDYTWYADPGGISVLVNGPVLTTPFLNASVTYYAGIDSGNVVGDLVPVTVSLDPELAGGASIVAQGDSLLAQPSGPAFTYQWLDSLRQPITGATEASFVPDTSGTFFVLVTGTNCSDTSAAFVFEAMTTGLPSLALGAFQLYPNPSQDRLHLHWTQPQPHALHLTVYDLRGQAVHRQTVPRGHEAATLMLAQWPAGTYLLVLHGPQGWLSRRFTKI